MMAVVAVTLPAFLKLPIRGCHHLHCESHMPRQAQSSSFPAVTASTGWCTTVAAAAAQQRLASDVNLTQTPAPTPPDTNDARACRQPAAGVSCSLRPAAKMSPHPDPTSRTSTKVK